MAQDAMEIGLEQDKTRMRFCHRLATDVNERPKIEHEQSHSCLYSSRNISALSLTSSAGESYESEEYKVNIISMEKAFMLTTK
jgi:hypothetical protein